MRFPKSFPMIIVVAAAVLFALWHWVPPSSATDAALRHLTVRFEVAKASIRPPALVGKKLSKGDRAALQQAFIDRVTAAAGGKEFELRQH